jgi:GMP synthase (glutamine-hydrolysing)
MPNRSAFAVRHLAFEDLGLLSNILAVAGWTVSYRDAPTSDLNDPALAGADLLIVLGGPIGVNDSDGYPFLKQEVALLRSRLAQDRPTLGICLGGQLIAHALGAPVYPAPVKEIGWGPVQLTDAGRSSCLGALATDAEVLHWHGDTFDLPAGTMHLAATKAVGNQAFSRGRNILALQFHLEADPARLEEWYVGHTVELTAAGVSVANLRAGTHRVAHKLRPQAEAIFGRWLSELSA